jgi:hypothetical protein
MTITCNIRDPDTGQHIVATVEYFWTCPDIMVLSEVRRADDNTIITRRLSREAVDQIKSQVPDREVPA